MKQFFYKIEEAKDDKPAVLGSFNIDKVLRSVYYDGPKIVVILDDFHEMVQAVPQPGKNGKVAVVNKRQVVNSEIYMNEEDSARFRALTEVGV